MNYYLPENTTNDYLTKAALWNREIKKLEGLGIFTTYPYYTRVKTMWSQINEELHKIRYE